MELHKRLVQISNFDLYSSFFHTSHFIGVCVFSHFSFPLSFHNFVQINPVIYDILDFHLGNAL